MNRQHWEVVVVGAGAAGAVAARQLALAGAQVLLVERAALPRPKVCGGCLHPRAVALLARIGLGDLLDRLHAPPLTAVHLAVRGRTACLPLSEGRGLTRATFDAALVDAAVAAGAELRTETHATLIERDGGGRCVSAAGAQLALTPTLSQGEREPRFVRLTRDDQSDEVDASVVLAADGLGSRLLLRAGQTTARVRSTARFGAGVVLEGDAARAAAEGLAEDAVTMAVARGGYVGLARAEAGRISVAAAFDKRLVAACGGLGAAAHRVLTEAGLPTVPALRDAGWRGTPALTQRPRQIAVERVLALGDAAGYVEPFTGEGMAWALAAAVAVVPHALRALSAAPREQAAVAQAWSRELRQRLAGRWRACAAVAQLVRRPALMAAFVSLAQHQPALTAPWLRPGYAGGEP